MCSASATITAGYIRTRCLSAINIIDLSSYALQNSGTHHCQTFVYPPCLPPLPLSYTRTHCSSAVNITDLCSYALQNLVGTHCSQTFLYPPRLPLLPLATFVRAAHLPSTSPNSVHTHCRTSFVCAAVLHSTLRSPTVIIANLASDKLQNVVDMHHCPTFVRAARLPSTSPNSICTNCRT